MPDCAWCGAACDQPHPYPNRRGEVFCSPAHRSASNRALARVLGAHADSTPHRRRNPDIDPRLLAADGARYFSDEALAEADQEAGSSKSRTALVLMRPRDFLAMAEPGMREESQAALERVLDAGVRLSDVPRLFIATSRTDPHRAVVTGHEGRHRSRALLARGVTQMPVRLHSLSIRWGEQTDPKSWDYEPVLPSVLVGEGANGYNALAMPIPLHYPELVSRLRPRTNPRRNPEFPENDPSLTLGEMRLRRVAPGAYEYDNAATGTTWGLARREVPGKPEWMFVNANDGRDGGNDVYYSLAETKEALVEYLRGRHFDPRWGWHTR